MEPQPRPVAPQGGDQSLAAALDRLDLRPVPTSEQLAAMGDEERQEAVRASMVTTLNDLPEWYQRDIRQWAAGNVAQVQAAEAARHAS